MLFPSEDIAVAFRKLVILQFESVWNAANIERGIVQGDEVKAGTSHPDFGKTWGQLPFVTQSFLMFLHVSRLVHFRELAASGELAELVRVGNGEIPLDSEMQKRIARRFHDDWVAARRILYSFEGDEERQRLVAAGVGKPFGEHEGDKAWDQETPIQQENDLRMVSKWACLLAHCSKDAGELGKLYSFITQ